MLNTATELQVCRLRRTTESVLKETLLSLLMYVCELKHYVLPPDHVLLPPDTVVIVAVVLLVARGQCGLAAALGVDVVFVCICDYLWIVSWRWHCCCFVGMFFLKTV